MQIRRPTKKNVVQFVLFNFGGMLFFVVGYGIFALLYGAFDVVWWLAKIVADLVGWTANYIVQRYLAFREESKEQSNRRILKKFVGVSLLNVPLDYAIVGGLKLLGVSPFLGLWISSLFFTVWKYLWYKRWVFAK
jgi:putative flippase GtrA